MREMNVRFSRYVCKWMGNFRNRKACGMEQMSEKPRRDSRGRLKQEKGRTRLSKNVIRRMPSHTSGTKAPDFINGPRTFLLKEEFENE